MIAISFPASAEAVTVSPPHVISKTSHSKVVSALSEAQNGRWSRAGQQIAQINDPLATRIYQWLSYTKRDQEFTFEELSSFIQKNSDWPSLTALRIKAEKAMPPDMGAMDIVKWHSAFTPITIDARERYISALIQIGQKGKASSEINEWWREASLNPAEQDRFLAKYAAYITKDAHIYRFDYLMRKGHYTNARAIAQILGNGYPALANARIAVAEGKNGVDSVIASVPAHLSKDPGLLYERLKWRRERDRDFDAIEILHNAPKKEHISNPDEWWRERHIIARRLIERGQYESAYWLVAGHLQSEGFSFAQAEFVAGWLALRYLNKPWEAFQHFEKLYYAVETPISKARGAYWAGRASEALGHKDVATAWYKTGAEHHTTYYGQLSLMELDKEEWPAIQAQPKKTIAGQANFAQKELVQAAKLLHQAGFRKETGQFLTALSETVETPEDFALTADLAIQLDQYHNAVRIAKTAINEGVMLLDYAFPTMLNRMRDVKVEWALVHALMRQESGFDYNAQSHAGARGLMQLMPATAKETAAKIGIAHRTEWLTQKPDHNILLGSAYLQKMLDRYNGSYALALAAYNAGPGRVDRWIKEFGDPRQPHVDMIDWVERIPIYETRNYVQRVLESVYVYRIKFRGVQQSHKASIHVAER